MRFVVVLGIVFIVVLLVVLGYTLLPVFSSSDESDQSWYDQAMYAQDIKLCDKIISIALRRQCLDELKPLEPITPGTNTSGSTRTPVPEPTPAEQEHYDDAALFSQALVQQNSALCTDIVNEVMRLDCLAKTASAQGVANESGEELTLEEQVEIDDNVLFQQAVTDSNVSACDGILDEYFRNQCFLAVNAQPSEPQVPDDIEDKQTFQMAIATRNIALCEDIVDNNLRNDCIGVLS